MVNTFKLISKSGRYCWRNLFGIHYKYKATSYDKIFEIWYFVYIYVETLNISFVNI